MNKNTRTLKPILNVEFHTSYLPKYMCMCVCVCVSMLLNYIVHSIWMLFVSSGISEIPFAVRQTGEFVINSLAYNDERMVCHRAGAAADEVTRARVVTHRSLETGEEKNWKK